MEKAGIKYFVVDAFTETPFKGNPAAVCFLEHEKDDVWLQSVATEFNISQTCYLIPTQPLLDSAPPRFRIRWFTPVTEVPLCGHATLAAAHILFSSMCVNSCTIEFVTPSCVLTAKKDVGKSRGSASFSIELDFPATAIIQCDSPDNELISKALNGAGFVDVKTTFPENDLLVVLPTGKDVTDMQPNLDEIGKYPHGRGIIVTGASPEESGFDFISRFFAPRYGIPEDPVCGTAHCALATYWSEKLGKTDFVAYQASPRGGILELRLDKVNRRVYLKGKAKTIMTGCILV